MIDPSSFFAQLVKLDIRFFTGVPDSLLRNICSYIHDFVPSNNHIIAANEGGALSDALVLGLGLARAQHRRRVVRSGSGVASRSSGSRTSLENSGLPRPGRQPS